MHFKRHCEVYNRYRMSEMHVYTMPLQNDVLSSVDPHEHPNIIILHKTIFDKLSKNSSK